MIIYKKPKDVRFTDMVIWVDNNMYKEDCDNEKLYEYLYLIICMLSCKKKLMNTYEDYTDFYMWASSVVYRRIKSKKQYEYDENGNPKQQKIRSILNYLNYKISGLAVDFIRTKRKDKKKVESIEVEPSSTLEDVIDDNISGMRVANFKSYMHSIPKTINQYMKKLPYYSDKSMYMNIYTSCLLSFLNSITLSNAEKQRLSSLKFRADRYQEAINDMYKTEKENSTILYHLDENMRDYITLLTRCITHIIMNDLSQLAHENMPASSNMKTLMADALDCKCNQEDKQ